MKNIDIPISSFEFNPTELTLEGTLLNIVDHLCYQYHIDLNLHKKNNLESTFIEITNPNKSNVILDCIYRYPIIDLIEFNN